jgi:hypothetical protein
MNELARDVGTRLVGELVIHNRVDHFAERNTVRHLIARLLPDKPAVVGDKAAWVVELQYAQFGYASLAGDIVHREKVPIGPAKSLTNRKRSKLRSFAQFQNGAIGGQALRRLAQGGKLCRLRGFSRLARLCGPITMANTTFARSLAGCCRCGPPSIF